MKTYLAVIPARGGSKGIPRKNLRLLAGRPLIAHTIEVARQCPSLTHVIVSTDDVEIAEVARHYGAEVPFLRPADLAGDMVAIEPVLQHAVIEMEKLCGVRMDFVVLLLPTCPLRTVNCVEDAIRLQRETDADSMVSLAEHDYPVYWLKKIVDGRIAPYRDDSPPLDRRQDASLCYRKTDAVFVVKRDLLMVGNSLIGENSRPLVMRPEESVDINTEWDFQLAEWLMGGAGRATQSGG